MECPPGCTTLVGCWRSRLRCSQKKEALAGYPGSVFGGDHKAVSSGTAKGEHEAKVAVLNAIDELKETDERKNGFRLD
jgi:hypothetical protein